MYKIDEIIEEKPCIPCNEKPPEKFLAPQVEDSGAIDIFEDLLYNSVPRSSLQPNSARASFLDKEVQKTSIHEADLQSCECFREKSSTINSSIKGKVPFIDAISVFII